MLLVELHVEEALEQRGEAERGVAEQLRGDARVEDRTHVPPVVLLQEAQVVVRVVEHDFDAGILEQSTEPRRHADRERIDDGVALSRRELEEIDAIHEAVEARALGIECDLTAGGDLRGESLDAGHGVEIEKRCLVRALSHADSSLCWQIGTRGNVAPRAITSRGLRMPDNGRTFRRSRSELIA